MIVDYWIASGRSWEAVWAGFFFPDWRNWRLRQAAVAECAQVRGLHLRGDTHKETGGGGGGRESD